MLGARGCLLPMSGAASGQLFSEWVVISSGQAQGHPSIQGHLPHPGEHQVLSTNFYLCKSLWGEASPSTVSHMEREAQRGKATSPGSHWEADKGEDYNQSSWVLYLPCNTLLFGRNFTLFWPSWPIAQSFLHLSGATERDKLPVKSVPQGPNIAPVRDSSPFLPALPETSRTWFQQDDDTSPTSSG